jgi:ribonucleotide reductase alpha subunit
MVKTQWSVLIRHAKKGRALGLGVMGWHTFLQQKDLPFNSIASTAWTHTIFSDIKNKAEAASRQLAVEYGEPTLVQRNRYAKYPPISYSPNSIKFTY